MSAHNIEQAIFNVADALLVPVLLAALSRGDTAKLSEDLRIAFSITVLGLLIVAVAYAISLVRDRLYSHDLSDLEYVVSAIGALETRPAEVPV